MRYRINARGFDRTPKAFKDHPLSDGRAPSHLPLSSFDKQSVQRIYNQLKVRLLFQTQFITTKMNRFSLRHISFDF